MCMCFKMVFTLNNTNPFLPRLDNELASDSESLFDDAVLHIPLSWVSGEGDRDLEDMLRWLPCLLLIFSFFLLALLLILFRECII